MDVLSSSSFGGHLFLNITRAFFPRGEVDLEPDIRLFTAKLANCLSEMISEKEEKKISPVDNRGQIEEVLKLSQRITFVHKSSAHSYTDNHRPTSLLHILDMNHIELDSFEITENSVPVNKRVCAL
jgi:hypothetical protein